MRNPFDHLSKRRQQQQRQAYVEREAHQAQGALSDTRTKNRRQEKDRYDAMVSGLLNQFIQSAAQDLKTYSYDWGWSVGRWDRLAEDNSLRWHSILDVQLVYELNDIALYFEVSRHRRRLRAGLGQDELALALHELFSD